MLKEKYPNAMIDFMKEPFLQCGKCGYKLSGAEYKKVMKEQKGMK